MDGTKLEVIDNLDGNLRRSLALSDLLSCVNCSELGEDTVNEIGYQINLLIEQSRSLVKQLCEQVN